MSGKGCFRSIGNAPATRQGSKSASGPVPGSWVNERLPARAVVKGKSWSAQRTLQDTVVCALVGSAVRTTNHHVPSDPDAQGLEERLDLLGRRSHGIDESDVPADRPGGVHVLRRVVEEDDLAPGETGDRLQAAVDRGVGLVQ